MKAQVKKLTLNRETVRVLQDAELRLVAGGQPQKADMFYITQAGPGCCPSTHSSTNLPANVEYAAGIMQ